MKNIEKFFNTIKINFDINRLLKNENQKIAVMCYAENEYGEVLMLERYKEPFAGKLVPPGGKVKDNEEIIEAMKREYMEETGFNLENIELKAFTSEEGPEHYNWILFIFLAKIKKEPLPECNEGILKWINKKHFQKENLTDIDKKIIPYLYDEKDFIYFFEINYDENKKAQIINIQEIKKPYSP
ncbi:ADP-ribose pyrophosphatase [Marinitoga piezophila KA3]|uniref:ADP-ribose pyrophosphatase n=1 Tax=Marinitoga piezophila (strain DSM 14283 / JCM 11233 / KA3) TaxID=443254 RepID=H2J2P8_MARPK|nr:MULTISPECIES: NUDIX domain-containing protein [Marinitoga]AEX84492.1 ADP-ribose pyrophosphatase [Marinitoga piezophila KA3]